MAALSAGVSVGACAPTVTAGYDVAATVHGPLAGVVGMRPDAPNYAFSVGAGARDFTIELGVQPLATQPTGTAPVLRAPDAGTTPRYLATTTSCDLRWTPMRFHVLSLNVHVGPSLAVLDDRSTGQVNVAQGFRTGIGVALTLKRVSAFVDVYRGGYIFLDGPAMGNSQLVGVTLGVGLR